MTSSPDRPLFRRWPQLAERIPFIELGTLPTPVENAAGLLNGVARIEADSLGLTIKRDDLSAEDYGGNKVRKLEFLLADALAQSKQHVITYGGLGSNHARATALSCRKLGLQCTAILTPEPMTPAVQATLDHHAELGTRIETAEQYSDAKAACDRVMQEHGAEHCYEIPYGGSSPVGTLGFVNAALELSEQLAAGECMQPDVIYAACGTAGTVAGLALGLELAGLPTRIEALQVTPASMDTYQMATSLVQDAIGDLQEAGIAMPLAEAALSRLNVSTAQLGQGYAEPTRACREAADIWQPATRLPMSLTYTAKAFAGLIDDARSGKLQGQQVLFWNTYDSRRAQAN